MFKAIQTSVSGLIASTSRFNVAASNIVNSQVSSTPPENRPASPGLVFSPGYIPQRVEQSTSASGGVRTKTIPVSPASLSVYDPSSPLANGKGFINIPNVSLPAEFGELNRARYAYKANIKVLQTLDATFKSLLDSFKA